MRGRDPGGTGRVAAVARPARRQHSLVWLQGLACGAVVALTPGIAVLLAVLLAPGLVVLLLDHEPGRPTARCVLLIGLATCVHPLRVLWPQTQNVTAALDMVSDLQTLGTAWSAAAAGWLLAELAPLGAKLVLETLARARAAKLRARREKLVETWGDDGSAG